MDAEDGSAIELLCVVGIAVAETDTLIAELALDVDNCIIEDVDEEIDEVDASTEEELFGTWEMLK